MQELPVQSLAAMNLPQDEMERVLDLVLKYIQYQYARMELEQKEYQLRMLDVVKAKHNAGKPSIDLDRVPVQPSPDEGHAPGKVGMGFGYRKHSLFAEINLRPAYHDLLDPDKGYLEGSQLNIFDLSGRYYEKSSSMKLQKFHLIDIVSLPSRDLFFKPISWKLNTGFDREIMPDGSESLLYRLNTGAGYSYDCRWLGIFYGMLETDLNVNGRFQDNFALGAGLTIAILKNINNWWRVSVQGQGVFYGLGDCHTKYLGTLAQNFKLTQNTGINIQLKLEKNFGFYRPEISVGWNYYF